LLNGQNSALVAWWFGGALRNLSFVTLPLDGDRANSLKEQFSQLVWAGELEGWLVAEPKFHLIADGAMAGEWETVLRGALDEPVQVTKPLPFQELAAATARRATAASAGAVLLPAEFTTRYHQQFVDRLWLRGLFAAGVFYMACVAVYFCAVFVLGIQTRKVEQQVAAISASYTNTLQLKARYEVLKERQDLKFAALDCWKLIAEQLPEGVSLQRFSFVNGQDLKLSGTVPQDQIIKAQNFSDALRKAKINGQPLFDPLGGEPFTYRLAGGGDSWNFSLVLKNTGEATP
jgi:hypothetical protein